MSLPLENQLPLPDDFPAPDLQLIASTDISLPETHNALYYQGHEPAFLRDDDIQAIRKSGIEGASHALLSTMVLRLNGIEKIGYADLVAYDDAANDLESKTARLPNRTVVKRRAGPTKYEIEYQAAANKASKLMPPADIYRSAADEIDTATSAFRAEFYADGSTRPDFEMLADLADSTEDNDNHAGLRWLARHNRILPASDNKTPERVVRFLLVHMTEVGFDL